MIRDPAGGQQRRRADFFGQDTRFPFDRGGILAHKSSAAAADMPRAGFEGPWPIENRAPL